MRNLIIYCIVNLINGKVYIGQTRQGLARRRGEHVHRFNLGERDHKLYQAMRKYGIENFKFEVLCHCLKPEYLDEMERHFIAQYDSFNNGYNMTCGGDSASVETRQKLSRALKGRKIHWADKLWMTRRNNTNAKSPRDYVAKGAESPKAKSYLVRMPSGEEIRVKGMNQFCKEHGLSFNLMLAVLYGKQRHHKGYSLLARFND
jgi:group I intron endonuclease